MSTQVRSDRSLRIVTICTMLPASILLIATGISTRGVLPTIGLVPMTLSALLGAVSLASGTKSPVPYKSHMDLVLAIFLMAIMVPTWVFLTSAWNPRMAMLCSYSVMPLMVNFCIHTYLALQAMPKVGIDIFRPRSCPNCNHVMPPILPRWQHQTDLEGGDSEGEHGKVSINDHVSSENDLRQGLMHAGSGYQYERESSDFQTSGFNSPRQSSDTLDTSMTGYSWDGPGTSGVNK